MTLRGEQKLKSPISFRQPHFSNHDALGHTFRTGHWRAARESHAPPLLFFIGLGANIELLAPFVERLRGRDVITFDMPGVGKTDDFRRSYRFAKMANAARAIIKTLGVHPVDVMGVSWGGMLAQEFAYRHSDTVERLILAATGAGIPMVPGSPSTLLKMLSSHRYSNPEAIAPYLQELYGGSGHGLDTYASRMTPPSSTGYLHQLLAVWGWTSARKLSRVSAKTLILMGAEDRVVPPVNGQILKALLKDARLHILNDAGHLFVLTHAEIVSGLVEDFLDAPSQTHVFKNDLRDLSPALT